MMGLVRRLDRQRLTLPVFLLLLTALGGCAAPGDDGIGGTGIQASTDGIGGTGAPVAANEHDADGIGGTGIVGEITALGSVVVNGLRVELPAGLRVLRNGQPFSMDGLSPGQVVAMVAVPRDGGLQAASLEIVDALVGPVGRMADASGRLHVLGQVLPVDQTPADLRPGERVSISGFWRPDGVLDVTRIERVTGPGPDLVLGPVTAGPQGLRVGGVPVNDVQVTVDSPGQQARVFGLASARAIKGITVQASPFARLRGVVSRMVVEGHPGLVPGGRVQVGPVRAALASAPSMDAPLRAAAAVGRRVVVDARVRAGVTEIERVRPIERPSPRPSAAPEVDTRQDARPVRPERPERPARIERPPKPVRPRRTLDTRPVDVRPAIDLPRGVVR